MNAMKGLSSLGNLYSLGKMPNIGTFNIPSTLTIPPNTTLKYDFEVEKDCWLSTFAFNVGSFTSFNFFNYTINRYWSDTSFSVDFFLFNLINNRPAIFFRKGDRYRIEIKNSNLIASDTTDMLFYYTEHDKDYDYQLKLFPYIWFNKEPGTISNNEFLNFNVNMKDFKECYLMGLIYFDSVNLPDQVYINFQFSDDEKLFTNWIHWFEFVYTNYTKFKMNNKQFDFQILNRTGAPIPKNRFGLFLLTNY